MSELIDLVTAAHMLAPVVQLISPLNLLADLRRGTRRYAYRPKIIPTPIKGARGRLCYYRSEIEALAAELKRTGFYLP